MILRARALEMVERRFVLALVIEDIGEIDARFGMVAVELQRLAQRGDRAFVVAHAVLRITDARDRLRRFRSLLDGRLEELLRRGKELRLLAQRAFAKERTADLQHEIGIVGVAELECAME